ncbi:MAG: glycosyltransferase [Bacteroidales bacterium]|nr:glycosyltransferase [Bacteroidales bacterium]
MSKVEVSVVMSVYNGEEHLKEAIDSILNQTYSDYEFIIVNDGSTDNSLNIINSYNDKRIKLINQENKGLAVALNNGIKNSCGEYIARLDADDIAMPSRLEKQILFLKENEKCVLLGSNAIIIDQKGGYMYISNQPTDKNEILKLLENSSPFFHSSVIFKKDVFYKCGGYYEKIKHNFEEDIILWTRIKEFGELNNFKEPLIKFRLSPSSITTTRKKKHKDLHLSIAKNIIKNGDISEEDRKILNNITKRKSRSYKYGMYHANIGVIHLLINSDRKNALINFKKSIVYYPFSLRSWFFLILSILPFFFVKQWKKYRKIK